MRQKKNRVCFLLTFTKNKHFSFLSLKKTNFALLFRLYLFIKHKHSIMKKIASIFFLLTLIIGQMSAQIMDKLQFKGGLMLQICYF